EDAEDRDGERQAFGKLVLFERSRPKPGLGGKIDGAEDHSLGREDRREDLQERRDHPRPVGGEGAEKSHPREQQHDMVAGLQTDDGGGGREKAHKDGKERHGLPITIRNLTKYPQVLYVGVECGTAPPSRGRWRTGSRNHEGETYWPFVCRGF